jgi:hypothetical protein
MKKPNFFIVGAPKCGTTAMDYYLSQHPEIFMAEKELHFFAVDLAIPEYASRQYDNYLRYFDQSKDEKILGESSVFYLYSRVAAKRIFDFDNAAKILIHLRNPVDVIASHHAQIIYEGYENVTELSEALKVEPKREAGDLIPESCIMPFVLRYRDLARFSEQVQRYLDVFGREQVHIVVFEDLKTDTLAVYGHVLAFLGVDTNFTPALPVVNANKRIRSSILQKFMDDRPAWTSKAARLIMPRYVRTAVKRGIKELNTKHEPRRPMDLELRRQLQRELAPEVERLSVLLDRDLSEWCAC